MKRIVPFALTLCMLLTLPACEASDYKNAVASFDVGDYADALAAFETLGDYEDSAEWIDKCNYGIAQELLYDGNYEDAYDAFILLGTYEDSADMATEALYQIALAAMDNEEYDKALELFAEIEDYEDSSSYIRKINDAIREEKWEQLYDYIEENGVENEEVGAKAIFQDIGTGDEYETLNTISIYALNKNCIAFHSDYESSATGMTLVRKFTVLMMKGEDEATWDSAMCIGIRLALGTEVRTSMTTEEASGTLDIATCTKNTALIPDDYRSEVEDYLGITTTSTDLSDFSDGPSSKAFGEILDTVPEILNDTGLGITIEDFGFKSLQ